MPNALFHCLLSAVVAVISSVATVWYLSANEEPAPSAETQASDTIKAKKIEVGSLVVNNDILLVDPKTNAPSIEIKDGSLYVQKDVYAERVGAFRVLSQKLQTTPDNPLNMKSGVFGEIAFTEDGGATFALKSPRESHSLTIGFDKNEKGCILSKNNDDQSMVAQAVFLKPSAADAAPADSAANYPPEMDAVPEETPFPEVERPVEADAASASAPTIE